MTNEKTIALPSGYQLENYRLEIVLGYGGFGITYRSVDEDLQEVVALKEYLPREVAFRDRDSTVIPLSESDREMFDWGLERFLSEARTLARFHHPNIVGVHRFIRANGTAYLVMDYCEGESLETLLEREGTLTEDQLETLLVPLLDALETLHDAGVTHRDIKPGNIYLREDGSPVLLDFGAARQALAQHSRSVTAMATPGYAAFEQYSTKGKQGPWTDIYGLGATLYRCVTGERPPDSSDRMLEDDMIPVRGIGAGRYSPRLLTQIDAALRLRPEDRPQSIIAWKRSEHSKVASAAQSQHPDRSRAKSISATADQSQVTKRGGSQIWPWLLVVGVLLGYFIWPENEQPHPKSNVTPNRPDPPTSNVINNRYKTIGTRGDIVLDTRTGHEWQRCSLGQTWNGNTCLGEAQVFTWDQAHQEATLTTGWRLPSIDELATLTFCSSGRPSLYSAGIGCEGNYQWPTIVEPAFPNTPSHGFWSGSRNSSRPNQAWYVSFLVGAPFSSGEGTRFHVRFIRVFN